ncbi:hypothetical protein [Streptomyces sp. MZ04]|uniref:hypothetical protein n=1 Tax=Streptomyces sp. MZ04 TaxID=2559236 RepID=UPI00107ED518|nr:hypothetical protein [Streptomyces sp. MZ04]TGB13644.1 hypothetical protein E2651_08720 [Streptomyces sp. MZ04]
MNRSRLALVAALTLSAVLLAGGCGDPGDLRSAGPTPTADGPTHLWPKLPPPSAPAEDYGVIESVPVKGVDVPDGDLRKVDPVTVARTDFDTNPGLYSRSDDIYKQTLAKLRTCGHGSDDCPVLKAYYRDLTGDGKDDLIVGIRLVKGHDENLDIRAYALEKRQLTQIMETGDAVLGVELAGHDVIIRAVSSQPGYEYRTVWSWDSHQKTMLPTSDEIVRSANAPSTKRPKKPMQKPTSKPTEAPTQNPAPTPSPSDSA